MLNTNEYMILSDPLFDDWSSSIVIVRVSRNIWRKARFMARIRCWQPGTDVFFMHASNKTCKLCTMYGQLVWNIRNLIH
jgi:hypothetical protein